MHYVSVAVIHHMCLHVLMFVLERRQSRVEAGGKPQSVDSAILTMARKGGTGSLVVTNYVNTHKLRYFIYTFLDIHLSYQNQFRA